MVDTRETSINYVEGEEYAHYYTNVASKARKLRKLVAAHPNEAHIEHEYSYGGVIAAIPPEWIKPLSVKKRISEVAIEKNRQRLKEAHAAGLHYLKNEGVL